ncbi:1,3-beta-galactosyl-N-acetylhexosamine phosphorylase [Sporanaerobium hydrogeniformans]|uniref:1,3-beta-galactosyl-N-acetylhexosamine phosphorylase n=1 Tax=Sporanaerobium hydrogeniformans TaxID=3072179 RepID=A0AC61DFD0_9FIRM|nr:1,3-beta-galactosyl-N-acetylhexosamine phosphorylase [Sporanaerobium hydrogeniformans]PHV71622.1 1,3-beta-galactosyl-N-acetylhexosamine phosphorylase [Sporanaerobium hydrogeniformans]
MHTNSTFTGGFTLPGEAGYEKLTLELAKRWHADVIRDSDGTELSPEILEAGYDIYSTICIIRGHNEWIKQHPEYIQQTFLMTSPIVATSSKLEIDIMKDFFKEQFKVNDTEEAMGYWEVYDRTTNQLVDRANWEYDKEKEVVLLKNIVPWHTYTLSFLAYRIWEEISMYNHVTNSWEAEHLIPIEPRYEAVREYLKEWLHNWCKNHPHTNVVRFTSLFYNFVWMWGASERNRHLFTDWGSYDFTVSSKALKDFEEQYGYALTAEDFINQGKFHVTHMVPQPHTKDWMNFIQDMVVTFGKELVEIVHAYGKKAYVFYDDSWVGLEPYGERFKEYGFDGLIKCVFSGYEARLCAGVDVLVHEIRLHPYLFPVGLGGAPTFQEGGKPEEDARKYWLQVRRALLREPIQRIGLGGYLHLVEEQPAFCNTMDTIVEEFQVIASCLQQEKPVVKNIKIGVLHAWGSLRPWTLSGHFHETYMHDLIHLNEALSGMPFEVVFFSFEEVEKNGLPDVQVIINAGNAGTAWSGGEAWKSSYLVETLTKWVHDGGIFIGVGEPSAVEGFDTYFRMAQVLGVDKDTGARICHGKWQYEVTEEAFLVEGCEVEAGDAIYLTNERTKVVLGNNEKIGMTVHDFGSGKGIYMGGFETTLENNRMLQNLLLWATEEDNHYITDNKYVECAYYEKINKLLCINQSDTCQEVAVTTPTGTFKGKIEAFGFKAVEIETK